jgi:tripartite-type tricarboxylate transporter receptor subunit TctC
MTINKASLRSLAGTCLILLLAHPYAEAQNWPERSIKLIAPSTAGGPPDVYARAVSDFLAKALGQPVIVENVPAAGGMIAAQQIQRAPADGYTLLVNTAGMMTITPNANKKANYKGDDFAQICQGVESALILAANPNLGAKTFNDLSQWVQSHKQAASYSSYSPGSPAHFLGYQLSEALKVDMTHVPYKSSPQQITDMIGGVAPLGFVQIATATPQVKAGKLIAYATTSEQRSAALPEVPTVAELGMPQLTTTVWFGLSAPKSLPPAIVKRLTEAHQQMTASPEFNARMNAAGLNVTKDTCGAKFLGNMNRETERWARVVKATGFQAD